MPWWLYLIFVLVFCAIGQKCIEAWARFFDASDKVVERIGFWSYFVFAFGFYVVRKMVSG